MSTMLSLSIDPLLYVWKLPEFNGDYRGLQIFIDLVDRIQPLVAKYDSFSQTIICDNIKAKLKGNARDIIEINTQVTDWAQIRKILISNFGVKGTEEQLLDELRSTKFATNSAVFYNDVITALHKLNLKTKQTTDPVSASSSIESNKKLALTVFQGNLPEPMRALLCCRNPSSLEEANNILHECGYAFYCPPHSQLSQKPFQHRQNLFPFPAFGSNANQNSNVGLFGGARPTTSENNSNVGFFGGKPLDNSQFSKAFSVACPTTSQTNSSVGLFGGKPLDSSETHKVTQPTFKQPSTTESMEIGILQGQANQGGDPETQSKENYWANVDQQFPHKNCTQSGQNIPQPNAGAVDTSAETFSIASSTDRLPYIVVQGEIRPLKFIIDTGATHTILNPGVCSAGDIEQLHRPINVKTLQNDVQITHKAVIPMFVEIGDPREKMECCIHPFHDRFDGLLGNNVLLPLKAKVDLDNNVLFLGSKVIELHFKEEQTEIADGSLLLIDPPEVFDDCKQHEKPLVAESTPITDQSVDGGDLTEAC